MTRQKLILDLGVATNNTIKDIGCQVICRSDYSYNYTRQSIDSNELISGSLPSIVVRVRKMLLNDLKETMST